MVGNHPVFLSLDPGHFALVVVSVMTTAGLVLGAVLDQAMDRVGLGFGRKGGR